MLSTSVDIKVSNVVNVLVKCRWYLTAIVALAIMFTPVLNIAICMCVMGIGALVFIFETPDARNGAAAYRRYLSRELKFIAGFVAYGLIQIGILWASHVPPISSNMDNSLIHAGWTITAVFAGMLVIHIIYMVHWIAKLEQLNVR